MTTSVHFICGCNLAQKYGEKVYPNGPGKTMRCDYCGKRDIDGTPRYVCRSCGKEVDQLHGLFVPHNCRECQDIVIARDKAAGRVCGMCHQPYSLCCC